LGLVAEGSAVGEEEVIATWRDGEITREEYSAWAGYLGEEGGLDQVGLERYVLTLWLADQPEARRVAATAAFAASERLLGERRLVEALRRSELAAVVISEEDLDSLETRFPEAFHKPRRVRLRNLFLQVEEGAPKAEREARRAEISALREQALAGADFGELAAAHSDSETRFRGGLVGLVKADDLPPAVASLVSRLEAGGLSDVVESRDGFTIFFCEEVLPPEVPTRQEVREKFTVNLKRERFNERWAAIETAVKGGAALEYFPERAGEAGTLLVTGLAPPVTTDELTAALTLTPAVARGEISPARVRGMLEAVATTRLLAQEAARRGVELGPSDRRALELGRLQALALAELTQRVTKRLEQPDEEAVRAYFESQREEFVMPAEVEVSALRIDFAAAEGAALRAAAREAAGLAREVAGKPDTAFAALARERSALPSASEGGYLGWLPLRRIFAWGPSVSRAVEALAVGETTPAIREGGSYWIVRLHDRRAARPMTYAEARELAEARLGQERVTALQEEIERELAASLEVVLLP
jgi:parvulin-like peptidyl-prolyl isomerase